jgi:hypothetical protein
LVEITVFLPALYITKTRKSRLSELSLAINNDFQSLIFMNNGAIATLLTTAPPNTY